MRVAQFTVLAAAAQLSAAATTYNLVDNYTPANFFDKFDFNSVSGLYCTWVNAISDTDLALAT